MENLFDELEMPQGSEAEDNTRITQIILYYSEEEAKEFKMLCKALLKKHYTNYKDSNFSDLVLKILHRDYLSSKPTND